MKIFKYIMIVMSCFLIIALGTSCQKSQDVPWHKVDQHLSRELAYSHSETLEYATKYAVDYYNEGFILISMVDGSRFLLNTTKKEVPSDLDKKIIVLNGKLENIYLVASATMDMFRAIGALEQISLSGIKEENWYIEEAKLAMQQGNIKYAGKYNEPDYEQILAQQCQLAIESTMILHAPEVKENLQAFGIPVLVDYSSYEEHPLGRTEWVKLYGLLTGKEEAATQAFLEQKKVYKEIGEVKPQGKTVVFFYITSNGTVVVRKPNDYVAKMINLAGGTYLFQEMQTDKKASSSINMQLEEFYAKAKEADFLIYNSTIKGEIKSLQDLTNKWALLQDFKAVQEENVWCATQNVYQYSMHAGDMIKAFHSILSVEGKQDGKSDYLFKLQ